LARRNDRIRPDEKRSNKGFHDLWPFCDE
jgi:hypothetical protein